MNVKDALYHACHDYPGGIAALAARMGVAESTLYGMANPANDSHGWPLDRFRQVVSFADKRPLHALCEENGGVFVPVVDAKGLSGTVPEQLSRLAAEFGDVARAAADAMQDGKLTARELAAFDTQIFELIAEAANTGRRLRADAEQASPAMRAVK